MRAFRLGGFQVPLSPRLCSDGLRNDTHSMSNWNSQRSSAGRQIGRAIKTKLCLSSLGRRRNSLPVVVCTVAHIMFHDALCQSKHLPLWHINYNFLYAAYPKPWIRNGREWVIFTQQTPSSVEIQPIHHAPTREKLLKAYRGRRSLGPAGERELLDFI